MNETSTGVDAATLDAALADILAAPADEGTLEMIVRRPSEGHREVLRRGSLDLERGLDGDNWSQRPSSRMPDERPNPDMQLNIMGARVLDAVAGGDRARWPLAGDQLVIDLDLRPENLPPGTRLSIGSAVIEVTAEPHTGCAKFRQRFGPSASRFVNTDAGRTLRLRGICAKVISAGTVATGDVVRKLHQLHAS